MTAPSKPAFNSVVLADDSILLRCIQPEDTANLHLAVRESHNELSIWMPWCTESYSLADSEQWCGIQEHLWIEEIEHGFAIIDKETGAYLGGCGINRIDTMFKTANLGYWVRSGWTGKGVASRSVRLLAAWAFNALALNRIEIICSVENKPSMRVAEKTGALREGILRRRLEYHGAPHDAALYSLLREDLNRG